MQSYLSKLNPILLSDTLDRHRKIHFEKKVYSCAECGKQFADNSNLWRHKKIHSGEKMYACDFCDKTFLQVGIFTFRRRESQ